MLSREVTPHPQSLSDPVARLFESEGELLRAVTPEHAPFYERLLASPALDKLFAAGLVRTERAEIAVGDYPLVLKHSRVDFVSDWREWPSLMLKDAALMVCELCLELSRQGFGALDIHPWNVLFDFSRPVFIDFSAIAPLERAWADEQAGRFRDYWILPLTFIKMGHPDFARSLRKSCEVTEPLDEFFKRRELRWFPFWYQRLRRRAQHNPTIFFEKLRERLEKLRLAGEELNGSRHLKSETNGKDVGQSFEAFAGLEAFAENDCRARTVSQLLDRLKPRTLLDIGCGDGLYAQLAEEKGIKVVAIDETEARVNALYRRVKRRGLHILPLLLDFSIPTTGQGRKKEFPSSTERLACDASLMLALLPRLFFEVELSFERIANLLAAYSRKYTIVEFTVPRGEHAFKRKESGFARYSLDDFVKAMERHFRLSENFELEQQRRLLLFERR
ncbi:MAG TPA: hypothetical protein VM911_21845 [Pyrinomonadaceae bacterium]|nr:hypothetical protein [Pyrinomonadaceae bacterium]